MLVRHQDNREGVQAPARAGPQDVKRVHDLKAEQRYQEEPARAGPQDVKRVHDLKAEQRYQEELAETSKPLTNAAILEWNRRRDRQKLD